MSLLDLARSALFETPRTVADDSPIREWRVTYPNGATMDVLFHPKVTRAEVVAIYPGASLEPLPDAPKRQATRAEAAELAALVGVVLAEASEAERIEALRVACADPEAALSRFRALAGDLPGVGGRILGASSWKPCASYCCHKPQHFEA